MKPEGVLEALREATQECCQGASHVGLAFSGGLDSSVVAALAREMASVALYTVGYPDYEDMKNAREASEILELPWVPLYLDDSILMEEAGSLLSAFPGLDAVTLSFELPLWALLKKCDERVVLAGHGADELFGGYARYERLRGDVLRDAMEMDFERLIRETVPREDRMARLHGRELRLPYCHATVLQALLHVEPDLRKGPGRKGLLREVATLLNLPRPLVERPKKAAQYGSGVMKRMKALAKNEGLRLGEFLRDRGKSR